VPNPEALHALRRQVKDLLAEKRYHQIIDILTDEVLAEYNDGELYMERGSIFARFNEPDRAIIDLTKAAAAVYFMKRKISSKLVKISQKQSN
jgi:hypothetical protein